MTGIMGAVFSPSENKMPQIKLLIADNDKNLGSEIFIEAFRSPQVKGMFALKLVDEKKGRELISNNSASAFVIIPENFSKNLINKTQTELIIIKNPAEQFLPNVAEEFVKTLSTIFSGAVQIFNINNEMAKAMKNAEFDNSSITALLPILLKDKSNSDKFKLILSYLKPPLLELKKELKGKIKNNSGFNIFAYILPGISIMFLLFIIEIFIRDILSDRENGKLQRMMFAPLRAGEYITARILSGWLMGILTYFIIVIIGVLLFNIHWGNYFYLFLLIAITCFWITAFFALLNSFFKNRNQAGAFVAPIVMTFSAFGGSIIPSNQLPEAFRWISNLTLNHWFITGSISIQKNIFPLTPIIILFTSAIILYIIASISLNKRIIT